MMIAEEIKNLDTSKGELRKFGLTVGSAFILLTVFLWWREFDFYYYLLAPAAFLCLLGLAGPGRLKRVYLVWMTIGIGMGWIMTRLILIAVFYLLVTPIGLVGRLCGKNFLDLSFAPGKKGSYWHPKTTNHQGRDGYEKQF
jgi:hypothetical protein